MKGVLLVLAILSVPAIAPAAPKTVPSAPSPADPAALVTESEEVTVTAAAACLPPKLEASAPKPRIVSTFPANGATVRPGVLVLRVTFDQPMTCKGFFAGLPRLSNPCPPLQQQWVLSFDRRTVRTVCHVGGNVAYGVSLSGQPDSTFVSLAGRPLDPYQFRFSTSVDMEVRSTKESLAQDPDSQPPEPQYTPIPLQEAHVRKP